MYISDHFPTFYVDQIKSSKPKQKPFKIQKIYDETQNNLNNLLKSTSFQNITSQEDPAVAFSNFFTLWHTAAELSFPEVTVIPKSKLHFTHSPWMTPGLLVSCKTKQKLFSKNLRNQQSQILLLLKLTTICTTPVETKLKKVTTMKCFIIVNSQNT